ncbi:MAG TPA: zinc-binding dehydrogenase [Spirochaetia bacterium]|nr:zinc-binding dehydrogenase [Spirochaetia bacterium]
MKSDGHAGRTVVFGSPGTLGVERASIGGPGPGQVLVEMKACGICHYDIKCFKNPGQDPVYSARPGHEGVGIVAEVGAGVEDLRPGDKVTSVTFGGALSDFYLADRGTVARIPSEVRRWEQWISEPIACVVNGLRHLAIEPGDDVVVLGAGYMGLLFVQGLPKELIHTLTAIDALDDRLALARKYGADRTVNPKKDDPVKAVQEITGRKVDLVIEATGAAGAIGQATEMLRNGGRLCVFGHHAVDETVPTNAWHMKGLHVLNTTPFTSRSFPKDLADAVRLMERGRYTQEDLISKVYASRELAAALHDLSPKPPEVIKAVMRNY